MAMSLFSLSPPEIFYLCLIQQCRVCCAYFPKSEVDKAIALIKEHADLNTEPGPNDGREAVMHTTGVSVRSAIKEAIATSFNVRYV